MRAPVLALWTLLCVVLTNAIHELAHALAGKALGYRIFVNINSSGSVPDGYRTPLDGYLVDAAGPAMTLLIAAAALALLWRTRWTPALTVIFCALMMRLLAMAASLRLPNDEARLGVAMGIGYWTLHAIAVAALLAMFVLAYRRTGSSWTWLAVSFPVVLLGVVVIVAGEQLLPTLVF